ncbi:mechanosensitive ion channel [Patescibacteria group bacterium]|nr:mechanosensitive ion channel [Patescibacteria group bacterium]
MNEMLANILHMIIVWSRDNLITVVLIVLGTWVVSKFIKRLVARLIRRAVPRSSFTSEAAEKKREETLISIIGGFVSMFIWVVAFLMVLDSFGVPIGALITGAGIIGVALGFGSQSLVKDMINGLFIIAENQFRIGDVVTIADRTGTVEGLTLRTTKLRQLDGTLHYIPNGEIKVTSNESMDFSMIDLTVDVGYNSDIDQVREVINQIGQDIATDPDFTDDIIEAPYFLRVGALADYSIKIHILGKVLPKKQYHITGILRERIKKAFEREGIEIPYPTNIQYSRTEK